MHVDIVHDVFLIDRAVYRTNDLWSILERNWSEFFWLTGEIPGTLQVMVDGMHNIFQRQIRLGRPQILDFRNQVSF